VRRDQSHTPKRHRGERGSCHPPVKRNPNDEATRKTLLFDPIQHKSVLLSNFFSSKNTPRSCPACPAATWAIPGSNPDPGAKLFHKPF